MERGSVCVHVHGSVGKETPSRNDAHSVLSCGSDAVARATINAQSKKCMTVCVAPPPWTANPFCSCGCVRCLWKLTCFDALSLGLNVQFFHHCCGLSSLGTHTRRARVMSVRGCCWHAHTRRVSVCVPVKPFLAGLRGAHRYRRKSLTAEVG